jgi:sugar lactone lactonase YvrE
MVAEQRVEVWDERVCHLGEAPHYDDRSGTVSWVDILGSRILWRDPGGGIGEVGTGAHVGAAVPREAGGFGLCLPDGVHLWGEDFSEETVFRFADAVGPPETATPMRANDAKADPAGRLWVGTIAYDGTPGVAGLYRLDPGADRLVRVLDGLTISNGLGWSPGGEAMYFIDSASHQVSAFPYDLATGELGPRRTFAEIPRTDGVPDGLCVDADGGLWVALWSGGRVRRFWPDGSVDRDVVLGPLVTSCAFAGPALDELLITTATMGDPASAPGAGMTYRHRPGDVVGLPSYRFSA